MSTTDVAASVPTADTRARAEGLPRLIYLARILNLCFFPLATVILGNLVILYVSQAQEALRAFDDGPEARWHVTPQSFSFVVASAHPAIIDGHSGIFSGPFIDFLTSYIGFIEGKEYQLTVEGRQSKHTSPQEHP